MLEKHGRTCLNQRRGKRSLGAKVESSREEMEGRVLDRRRRCGLTRKRTKSGMFMRTDENGGQMIESQGWSSPGKLFF